MDDQYKTHGVDSHEEDIAMKKLLHWIDPTFNFRTGLGKNLLPIGFFANVIDLGNGTGIAISMDGVGTKLLIAELLQQYDTIGIDCIAMNVNDLLCVGAEPVSFVDYIAVSKINEKQIEGIAKGLYEGSKLANVNIPGGELAQVRELLHPGEKSIDLIGTAIGIVENNKIITGKNLQKDDVIIGLHSSGIHSNGLTLARKLLLDPVNPSIELLTELLKPTRIYVKEVMALLHQEVKIKGMAHITGEGFLNILRLSSPAHYIIEDLPPVPWIFDHIKKAGQLSDVEMYKDFNMGVGFVLIIDKNDLSRCCQILHEQQSQYTVLGYIQTSETKRIDLLPKKIYSCGNNFEYSG